MCFSDNITNAVGVARHKMSIISLLRLCAILLPVPRPPAAAIWNDWELGVLTQLMCFLDNVAEAIGVARHNLTIISLVQLHAILLPVPQPPAAAIWNDWELDALMKSMKSLDVVLTPVC